MSATQLIDAIQMEDILLLLFLLIAMAWVITTFLLRIIRTVMPYPHSPYPMAGNMAGSPETSGGGIAVPLLFLFFSIIAFLVYTTQDSSASPSEDTPLQATTSYQKIASPIVPPKEEKAAPRKFSIEETFNKKKKDQENISEWVNQSPSARKRPVPPTEPPKKEKQRPEKFGIQLKALNNLEAAEAFQNTLRTSQGKYIILDTDGLYKVIVGRFDTREKAKKYQKKKGWRDGFIKAYAAI